MTYLITISSAATLIALCNALYDRGDLPSAFLWHLLATVIGIAAIFVIDGLFAFLIRRLPNRWFSPEARIFSVSDGEKKFYRMTRINQWKRHVPEWGCFTGFHKDQLRAPNDSTYIGRFLLESNYGVAGHLAGALLGFLILFLPHLRPLSIALPVAVINALLNILPIMILRFNTPSLRKLYRRTRAREEALKNTLSATELAEGPKRRTTV